MCFFVSGERVLPSLPWMWASRRLASEARLLLSQVVDRVDWIEAPPPLAAAFMYMYRLTGGSISGLLRKRATANPFTRASCYSWSSKENTSTTVWQIIRSVPHFLQPPAIDKEPESKAKMYVNQRLDEMAWTWKHILPHEHFRAKYWYVGGFIEYHFQPLSVGGFFWDTEIMTCEFDMWSVTWARLPQWVYTAGMYRDNKPIRADAVLRHHCMFKNLSLLFQEPRAGVHPERFL